MAKQDCMCRTPENDGSIVHAGKIVAGKVNGETLHICWKHRKFYKGWKKIR